MKKRKNIAIPMILAATIAAVSVPCSSQIVMASDTYQVGVSKGIWLCALPWLMIPPTRSASCIPVILLKLQNIPPVITGTSILQN